MRRGSIPERIRVLADTIDTSSSAQVNHHLPKICLPIKDYMKYNNHKTNGGICPLMRSFRPVWLINAAIIWMCLHTTLSHLFNNSLSSSFPANESVQRQLLSSHHVVDESIGNTEKNTIKKPSKVTAAFVSHVSFMLILNSIIQ
jgi:hypothetical protein